MTETAYIVLFLDTSSQPATVMGAGVFSEPSPTTLGRVATTVLYPVHASTYAEAFEAAVRLLADPYYNWVAPLTLCGRRRDARANAVSPRNS